MKCNIKDLIKEGFDNMKVDNEGVTRLLMMNCKLTKKKSEKVSYVHKNQAINS